MFINNININYVYSTKKINDSKIKTPPSGFIIILVLIVFTVLKHPEKQLRMISQTLITLENPLNNHFQG